MADSYPTEQKNSNYTSLTPLPQRSHYTQGDTKERRYTSSVSSTLLREINKGTGALLEVL